MDNLKEIFANNLIHYRKASGLTQLELAERLNYSDKAISKWERGESLPDIITLQEIAKTFNITLDELITEHTYDHNTPGISIEETNNKTLFNLRLSLLIGSGILLIAIIVFVILTLLHPINDFAWLVFIYAIPLIFIDFLLFSIFSTKKILILLFAELLAFSIFLILFLSIDIPKTWLFFLIPIPVFFILYFALSLANNQTRK